MFKTESGKWFFFVQCVNCAEDLPFAEAPSPEEGERVMVKGVRIECPHCKTEHSYDAKKVQRGLME